MSNKLINIFIPIFIVFLVSLFFLHAPIYADLWPVDYQATPLDDWFFEETAIGVRFYSINGGFLINYFINFLIIFYFSLIAQSDTKRLLRWQSLLRLFLITITGTIIDVFAFVFVGRVYVEPIRASLAEPFQKIVSSDLFLFSYPLVGMIVFVGVSLVFYKVYSYLLFEDVRQRRGYSLLFGLLSNPIWFVALSVIYPDFWDSLFRMMDRIIGIILLPLSA